ncbi:M67 family metallopeptidase [Shimazuella sp. AN120528]|uniref:M67 family metallopeptidase n=1 Tax=Shimazuella soli TaxID=1892854 RepID=UPI001F0D5A31|nr:M67 family metallopeptidase [Shimazuella soli]
MGKEQQTNLCFTFLPHVFSSMISHCMEQNPFEACGLLSGNNHIASTFWPMKNILRSPNAFQMDMDQIEITFKQMKEKGEQLVGIYHSHPTAAPYPSPEDVIHANYPEAVYVIVSLSQIKPEVACFRIQKGLVTQVQYTL